MKWIVIFLAAWVVGIGAYGFLRPAALIDLVKSAWKTPAALPFAVGLRLVLGVALLVAAPDCRYPDAMRALGVLALVAAVGGLLIGRARLDALVDWWAAKPTGFVRAWTLVAMAFGGFLIFAAL